MDKIRVVHSNQKDLYDVVVVKNPSQGTYYQVYVILKEGLSMKIAKRLSIRLNKLINAKLVNKENENG